MTRDDTWRLVWQEWADGQLDMLMRLHKAQLTVRQAYERELAWLRASLAEDDAPDWLVEMVVAGWREGERA